MDGRELNGREEREKKWLYLRYSCENYCLITLCQSIVKDVLLWKNDVKSIVSGNLCWAKCILQRQHNIMKVLYCVVEKIALKGSERRMRLLAFFLDGCFLYPRNVYAFESHWPQMFVWILHCKYLNYLVDRRDNHINSKSKRISNVFSFFTQNIETLRFLKHYSSG